MRSGTPLWPLPKMFISPDPVLGEHLLRVRVFKCVCTYEPVDIRKWDMFTKVRPHVLKAGSMSWQINYVNVVP
jgi:hypothetical protein